MKKLSCNQQSIVNQARWISNHGSSMTGYVERYGDSADFNFCSGSGGQAIWLADIIEFVIKLQKGYPSQINREIEQQYRTELALWLSFRRMCLREVL